MAKSDFDRWQFRFSIVRRAVSAIVAFVVALTISGCSGNIVEAPTAIPFLGEPIDNRPVVFSDGQLVSGYRLQPQDIIEIYRPDHDLMIVSDGNGGTAAADIIVEDQSVFRIPVWATRDFSSVRVRRPDEIDGVIVSLSHRSAERLLDHVRHQGLRGRVLPRDPGYVLPGDRVQIDLSHFLNPENGNRFFVLAGSPSYLTTVERTVDPNGRLQIPRLDRAVPSNGGGGALPCDRYSDSQERCATSERRATLGAINLAMDQIRVHDPTLDRHQHPLWRLERCMTAVTWLREGPPSNQVADPSELQWCRHAGVGPQFLWNGDFREEFQWHTYRLEPIDQTWTLVDVEGNAYQVPFLYGISVQEAIESNYQRMVGRSLDVARAIISRAPLFATVFPADGSAPYFAEITPDDGQAQMSNLGLRAGDRVFVTRYRPRTLE